MFVGLLIYQSGHFSLLGFGVFLTHLLSECLEFISLLFQLDKGMRLWLLEKFLRLSRLFSRGLILALFYDLLSLLNLFLHLFCLLKLFQDDLLTLHLILLQKQRQRDSLLEWFAVILAFSIPILKPLVNPHFCESHLHSFLLNISLDLFDIFVCHPLTLIFDLFFISHFLFYLLYLKLRISNGVHMAQNLLVHLTLFIFILTRPRCVQRLFNTLFR